jgi:synaptic vesicle membrane protein VAT-1
MNKALWIKKFGAPDVLEISDSKLLAPARDEIQIKVHYSGINFAEIVMRQGLYRDAPKGEFIPGYEFSGEVTAIGEAVTDFAIGDFVFGGSLFNGHQQYVTVPKDYVIKAWDGYSLEELAALPVSFITAYAALIEMAAIKKGDEVLIDCGTGGLGVLCYQLCHLVGAIPTGLTSSLEKKDFIESFGAKAMTHEEFNQSNAHYDMILNSQGGRSIRAHYKRLNQFGKIVCVGISNGIAPGGRNLWKVLKTVMSMPSFKIVQMFNHNRGVFALNALKIFDNQSLAKKMIQSMGLLSDNDIRPVIGKVYSYKNAALAHEDIQRKRLTGKALLNWSN